MRTVILAAVGIAAMTVAGPVMAQHAAHGSHWHTSEGGHWSSGGDRHGGRDWGGSVGGRWIGGTRAPGGWSHYVRPVKGWALPDYWLAPSFYITDWAAYGLAEPPYGDHWSRYYDDAVLVDQYGRVMGWADDVDWNGGYDDGYDYADRGDYRHDDGYDAGPRPGAPYPPPPPRVETRTYGYDGAPPPPPPQVVVTQGPGCGCSYDGYYYPPATTTTVTVTSVPVTTTTTTTRASAGDASHRPQMATGAAATLEVQTGAAAQGALPLLSPGGPGAVAWFSDRAAAPA